MDNSGDALMIEPHKTAPGRWARCNSVPLEYRELGYPSIAGAVRSVWQLRLRPPAATSGEGAFDLSANCRICLSTVF